MLLLIRKNILYRFFTFFLTVLLLQLLHIWSGLPSYDLAYLLLITVLLTLGDQWARVRFLCFTCALFLIDISPGFIVLPLILLLLKRKDIISFENKDKRSYFYKKIIFKKF
ncbi:hypothetical protein [Anoxybacter fermentans]|nr:hypothetical protein [Anoxybacter fermentans]